MKYNPRLGNKTGREEGDAIAGGFGVIESFFLFWALLAASTMLAAGYFSWTMVT